MLVAPAIVLSTSRPSAPLPSVRFSTSKPPYWIRPPMPRPANVFAVSVPAKAPLLSTEVVSVMLSVLVSPSDVPLRSAATIRSPRIACRPLVPEPVMFTVSAPWARNRLVVLPAAVDCTVTTSSPRSPKTLVCTFAAVDWMVRLSSPTPSERFSVSTVP
jgi:hypothetical protein